MRRRWFAVGVLGLAVSLKGAQAPAPALIDVTVREGTSMSVSVSPDGRTLAVDLQGQHLDHPGGRRRGHAHHRHLQRRAAAGLGARRQVDRLFRLPRRRLRPLVDRARWIAAAQADVGRVRRSRAGLVARRHARRLLVRPRQSARQRLQHLDHGRSDGRIPSADESTVGRLHAVLVARRQGNRLRLGARRGSVGVGRQRGRRDRAQGVDRGGARRCAVVGP